MKKTFTLLALLSFLMGAGWFTAPDDVRGVEMPGNIDTCKSCHQDRFTSYSKSVHGNPAIRKSPANAQGCESCHGPGKLHIQKGGGKGTGMPTFSKGKVEAATKSAQCLACHADSRSLSGWDMSKHKAAGISCDNCHTVHSGKKMNLKTAQPDLCISCHRDVRNQILKQSHHPLREGKMKCTDCHDQHGGFGPRMIKAGSMNDLCFKCHAEKRGPFLKEHPPVAENCGTCHTVHGSNHGKLLITRAPQLCQSCHDASGHPGNIYTSQNTFQGNAPTNRMFARSCLNCHSEVHGSNGPSTRGNVLVR
jgi:DmsE family decaheme c-type cytochrome